MEIEKKEQPTDLYSRIAILISTAQSSIRKTINSAIVETYWKVGQLIVEDEQEGDQRAEYGKEV